MLLIEQVDRLSRLTGPDWDKLKATAGKRVRVVALDLPTSWQLVKQGDDLTQWMMEALNSMMQDMLAAIARKDCEDRRRRTAQGIDTERNTAISHCWPQVVRGLRSSRQRVQAVRR